MLLGIITLLVAITLSGVAALYSVIGLIAIFSGAPLAVGIMGGVLEAAKLVVATWLYRNWNITPILLKTYFTLALLVLMLITSLGIFGYLSKAHLESSSASSQIQTQLNDLDSRVKFRQNERSQYEIALSNLDKGINEYYNRGRVTLGLQELKNQTLARDEINERIKKVNEDLLRLEFERNKILEQERTETLKVGPLIYVAELIFGESDKSFLERSVRYLIIIIMIVFDPLAVLMVIAANITFMQEVSNKTESIKIETKTQTKRKKEEKYVSTLSDYLTTIPVASTEDGVTWEEKNVKLGE